MKETSNPKLIIGYSDTETVKLDFDEAAFSLVKYWALKAMKRFRLRGFLILKSSEKHYHVVFNRGVSWSENMQVVAWVALLSHSRGLQRYCLMQCIKTSSTLRVSFKLQKPSPRVVFRFGKQSQQVKDFLKNRLLIKKITRKM